MQPSSRLKRPIGMASLSRSVRRSGDPPDVFVGANVNAGGGNRTRPRFQPGRTGALAFGRLSGLASSPGEGCRRSDRRNAACARPSVSPELRSAAGFVGAFARCLDRRNGPTPRSVLARRRLPTSESGEKTMPNSPSFGFPFSKVTATRQMFRTISPSAIDLPSLSPAESELRGKVASTASPRNAIAATQASIERRPSVVQ